VRRGELPAELPNIPRRLLETVRQRTAIPRLTRLRKAVSPQDGFTKYLFHGAGPEPFEAVRIPLLHRPADPKAVVCVSSQVGCALGCAFCATGRLGFRRNLAAWEMVDQVAQIQADSPWPVRGVVFMGMGEPLLNYDAVTQAAQILAEPCGLAIAGKAISISTAGIVPGIRRFTAERLPFRLIVSLTAADPARRRELMPVEARHPTPELMAALREHHAATGQRILLAWTMIAGVNTREADARQLAELTRGLPVTLDLIDVNDPTGRFLPPSQEELDRFRDALRRHLAMPVVRRYSGGKDIHAACGMLAGECPPPPSRAPLGRNSTMWNPQTPG
jgi:23S rRNA (adenine2503-C2)-methyltransferase